MTTLIKLYTSQLWAFLRPFVTLLLSQAGQALAAAAMNAVKTVATTYADRDGSAKREAAFELIVADLKKNGIQIGVAVTTSMVNAAIEAAVVNLKVR